MLARKMALTQKVPILVAGVVLVFLAQGAWAAQYKVLHRFKTYGEEPSRLIFDTAGNLYGTTSGGGAGTVGTVFRLSPNGQGNWTASVLHSFARDGHDGYEPLGGVTFDSSGELYGTTTQGGAQGGGTVFKLTPHANGKWTETVIYSFGNGNWPQSDLIFDSMGNLYGTTVYGGPDSAGTVFQLVPHGDGTWTENQLFAFDNKNGYNPYAGVVFDTAGNLYGTTEFGGAGHRGVVFQLSPNGGGGWTERVLHSFIKGSLDGFQPIAGLTVDASGNLLGTTYRGGRHGDFGTVFKLTPGGNGSWQETLLHSFDNNRKDGFAPTSGVTFDNAGNLYGTTAKGGANGGFGTVFKLTPSANGRWSETILHSFGNDPGASTPVFGVVFDGSGNLYGPSLGSGQHPLGAIFEITP